jgi:hypothetical protein
MEPQKAALATTSESPSKDSSNSNPHRENLVREWIVRFAVNADKPLDAVAQTAHFANWTDGFADVETSRLKAAFIACIRSLTFKTMPTIGDIRQHLTKAESNAAQLAAEQRWQYVLNYTREHFHPDLRDYHAPKLDEHTDYAVGAAGQLGGIAESDRDALVWCKKAFIEAYLAWDQRGKDKFLMPQGEVAKLLSEVAENQSVERLLQEPKNATSVKRDMTSAAEEPLNRGENPGAPLRCGEKPPK